MSRNVGGGRQLGSKNAVHVRLAAERRREPTVNAEELRRLQADITYAMDLRHTYMDREETRRRILETVVSKPFRAFLDDRSNQLQVIERDRLARALRYTLPGFINQWADGQAGPEDASAWCDRHGTRHTLRHLFAEHDGLREALDDPEVFGWTGLPQYAIAYAAAIRDVIAYLDRGKP